MSSLSNTINNTCTVRANWSFSFHLKFSIVRMRRSCLWAVMDLIRAVVKCVKDSWRSSESSYSRLMTICPWVRKYRWALPLSTCLCSLMESNPQRDRSRYTQFGYGGTTTLPINHTVRMEIICSLFRLQTGYRVSVFKRCVRYERELGNRLPHHMEFMQFDELFNIYARVINI